MDRGQAIYDAITKALDEGRDVYITTYVRVIHLRPKHRDTIRYRNGHCEIRWGKRWDSINWAKLTADKA